MGLNRLTKVTLRQFHRYISLIIAIQLLLWTISGIYFSFNKIENIRGEQYFVEQPAQEQPTQKDIIKISSEEAKVIVSKMTTLTPISVEIVDEEQRGSEYRGRELPLYKIVSLNENEEKINVYQNPFSGEIVAIRSPQWRIWDLMWGFHIMDWVERDNIDNILLKIFSFIALFTSISGVILFFRKK